MNNMIKELNNNKKLIIRLFVLFCIVILIVGITTIYFTQSKMSNMDNIVTTNINNTIGYSDNVDYMRNNLIPVIEGEVSSFVMKNSLNNYTNDDICKYQDDMYACSLYEFTITNNASSTQSFKISMSPTLNQYDDLYFIMYEGISDNITTSSKIVQQDTHVKLDEIDFNDLDLKLKSNSSKTYTIVFYIKKISVNQLINNEEKKYAATINIKSLTTSEYISASLGEGCYNTEALEDGTYKLTKFNGIDKNGVPVKGCNVTKKGEFYSVIVPSTYGGQKISTLGNSLFIPADLESFEPNDISTLKLNNNSHIEKITIKEGITTIEDGFTLDKTLFGDLYIGTFSSVGYDFFSKKAIVEQGVKFDLPNSLKYIGNNAFILAHIKEITLPKNLEIIGDYSFSSNHILTGISIPSNVKRIGKKAFAKSSKITKIIFEGAANKTSRLAIIGDEAFLRCDVEALQLPASIETIKSKAFYDNERLTTLEFVGARDGTSNLKVIEQEAFKNCSLIYLTKENPLIIPSSVMMIGANAFEYESSLHNATLNYIKYTGNNDLGDKWYNHLDVKEIIKE